MLTCLLEIDSKSFDSAERNIRVNKLVDRIRLVRASPNKPILFPLEDYAGPP